LSSIKKLLIIDDGGDLWLSIPWNELNGVAIAGVEQTQRGITRIKDSRLHIPPIISVASSGIKKIIEAMIEDKKMPLTEHLLELRSRLIKVPARTTTITIISTPVKNRLEILLILI